MKLTANFLTTAYKPKTLKLKLDEDPLHCRIHFLTFIESLEMIYSQYKETCEVIHYHTTIRGGDIEDYVNKATRNLLHENIYVHSRRLIAKITGDGVGSRVRPKFSDSSSSESDFSDDRKYKIDRRNKEKKYWKHTKQDLSESSSKDSD